MRIPRRDQYCASNSFVLSALCQPFIRAWFPGNKKLPWTRMHALKDYYGMAHILEEFPR
jgi:hypothetical protein